MRVRLPAQATTPITPRMAAWTSNARSLAPANIASPLESSARREDHRADSRYVANFARVPIYPSGSSERGELLPHAIRSLVARTTGQVPDAAVRVHRDPASRTSADRLGARAFTFGRDIHLGSRGSHFDARLLFHEAIHTLQQQPASRRATTLIPESPALERQASRATVVALMGGTMCVTRGAVPATIQRDAASSIREKLSYGFFDWVITDSEAMEALAMLGEIPVADLPAALASLGAKYVSRLLDNLPDAAKTGDLYQRMIQAIGPAGSLPYVDELLSYGFFDWAVTDTEVTRVYNVFANLAAPEQESFLTSLEQKGMLGRLISNSNNGHHRLFLRPWMQTLTKGNLTDPQKVIFHRIVEESPDGPVETLAVAAEKRFNVTVEPSGVQAPASDWSPSSLSATYLALELLPDAHIRGNVFLDKLGQFDKPTENNQLVEGVFNQTARELAINIQATDVQGTVLHEVGHAVDAMIGWTAGPEPAKPARGGWKQYFAAFRDCATDMVADSADGIQNLTAPQRSDVIDVMTNAMANHVPGQKGVEDAMKTAIGALPWFKTLAVARQRAVLQDPALKALEVGLNTPWFAAENGGVHLGDHVYQLSYPNEWVCYQHQARARIIKPYQFRGPEEWFAVAYEAYYTPDKRGKGAKLNDVDRDTKLWFDSHVDPVAPTR